MACTASRRSIAQSSKRSPGSSSPPKQVDRLALKSAMSPRMPPKARRAAPSKRAEIDLELARRREREQVVVQAQEAGLAASLERRLEGAARAVERVVEVLCGGPGLERRPQEARSTCSRWSRWSGARASSLTSRLTLRRRHAHASTGRVVDPRREAAEEPQPEAGPRQRSHRRAGCGRGRGASVLARHRPYPPLRRPAGGRPLRHVHLPPAPRPSTPPAIHPMS